MIPQGMLAPRADQMNGTVLENLAELAGRTCYDSMGTALSRSSTDYHANLLEVKHGSVYEHGQLTFEISGWSAGQLSVGVLGHPGIWLRHLTRDLSLLTCNARTFVDWGLHTTGELAQKAYESFVYRRMRPLWIEKMPCLGDCPDAYGGALLLGDSDQITFCVVEPESEEERWASLFLEGSRGFSHEQVRHRHQCAVSQRSTRYVDEELSEWVEHPLLRQWSREHRGLDTDVRIMINDCVDTGRRTYEALVTLLQKALLGKGVDRATARKQARGAARGYLGNALATEMIFSASVAQWKRMLRQRLNPAADAEIRGVYADVLDCLKSSRHGRYFSGMTKKPSPDGLGQVLLEQ